MSRTVALGFVLAFGAGLLVGWLAFGGEEAPTRETPASPPRAATTEVDAPPPLLRGAPPASTSESVGASGAAAEAKEPVDSETAEARVAALAEHLRRQGQATIDHAEVSARAQVEREITKELAAREDLERGGTMAFLRGLEDKWVAPFELLGSAEDYGALFERKAKGGRADGPTLTREMALGDGDTITFPPGKHALDVRVLSSRKPFPKDIAIEGYGMDETLLVLSDELRMRGDIHSLTFRDLTIHCGDNYLESMRDGPYTLRIIDCRIIGFDMGAGGSCMLSGRVGAFYASGSRIEAGYGRAPGLGHLFDVRGALLARLEDCVIVGPFRSIYYQWSGAAHVFDGCRFENLPASMERRLESPGSMVSFRDCTFSYLPEGARSPRDPKPVTDINPTWK